MHHQMQVIVDGLESEVWYFCLNIKAIESRDMVVGRVADVLMLGSPAAPSTSNRRVNYRHQPPNIEIQ